MTERKERLRNRDGDQESRGVMPREKHGKPGGHREGRWEESGKGGWISQPGAFQVAVSMPLETAWGPLPQGTQ